MKKLMLFIVILLLIGTILSGARPPGVKHNLGMEFSLGAATRLNSNNNLWAIDIPIIEFTLPFSNKYLHFDLAAVFQFGIENFFVDGYSSTTIRFTPIPKYFGIYARYMLSTGIVLGNHYGHILQLGANINIPIQERASLVLTGGYYWRTTNKLLDYLYTDKFYGSNEGLFMGAALRWKI